MESLSIEVLIHILCFVPRRTILGQCLAVNWKWREAVGYALRSEPRLLVRLTPVQFVDDWKTQKEACEDILLEEDCLETVYIVKCLVRALDQTPQSEGIGSPTPIMRVFLEFWNFWTKPEKLRMWCWLIRLYIYHVAYVIRKTQEAFNNLFCFLGKTKAFQHECLVDEEYEAYEALLWNRVRGQCSTLDTEFLEHRIRCAIKFLKTFDIPESTRNWLIWEINGLSCGR